MIYKVNTPVHDSLKVMDEEAGRGIRNGVGRELDF
jgi:hypothetical protein